MAALGDVSLLAFAFTAGALTFFAPCAYPLLPGYVSFYLGRTTRGDGGTAASASPTWAANRSPDVARPSTRRWTVARAVAVGGFVSAGFLLVYGVLAGVVVVAGAGVLAEIAVLELVVGAVLVVVGGLVAAGWTPPVPTVRLPTRRRSAGGYVAFGVLYAAAAAGCTAPVFIGVATVAMSAGPGRGLAAVGAYAAGMSVLMVGVTVGTALGRETLLRRLSRNPDRIHLLAGLLLVVAGLVQLYVFLFRFDGLAALGL